MHIAAAILLCLGSVFVFLGALGLIRMPDVYNRLQAGTKAVTLGSLSIILAAALYRPEWWPKLLLLAIFILFTNPIGSSVIARASRLCGIPVWQKSKSKTGDV